MRGRPGNKANRHSTNTHAVYYLGQIPYSWLFSRALYFTNLLSLASSRMQFSRIFAMDSISVILLKYFKVLYFTNLVCTTKFLKYKSLENFQLYGDLLSNVGGAVYKIIIEKNW